MKHLFFILIALLSVSLPSWGQELKTTRWSSYGVSFKAPSDIVIEDDSAEGFLAGNDTYYLTIQLLEGEGITKEELGKELKAIATDDEVTSPSDVQTFELPQFYGVQLKGDCEEEKCIYSYLLAKDGSCGFYISILYRQENDSIPDRILQSFCMEE